MHLPKLTVSSRWTVPPRSARGLLLWAALLSLAASGCGGGAVNPEPAAFTWLELGPGQLDVPGTSNVHFDPEGRPVVGRGGVRRWSRESGLWEARGTDLPFPVLSVDSQGTLYMPGYVLAADQNLWQRLPLLPDGLAMNFAPVADAQGNLYAAAQGAAFRLKPGTTAWDRLQLPTGTSADEPRVTPRGDRVYFTSTALGGTLELQAGSTVATRYAGDGPPTAFDEDGNSYYLRQSAIFKVAPDGTKTQLVDGLTTPAEAPRLESGLSRDRHGAFYAHALGLDRDRPLRVEARAGRLAVEDPRSDASLLRSVRGAGRRARHRVQPDGAACLRAVRHGLGTASADATEDGVHFSSPSVTVLGGRHRHGGLERGGAKTTSG